MAVRRVYVTPTPASKTTAAVTILLITVNLLLFN